MLNKIVPMFFGWMPVWMSTIIVGFLLTTFAITFLSLVVKLFTFLRRW